MNNNDSEIETDRETQIRHKHHITTTAEATVLVRLLLID